MAHKTVRINVDADSETNRRMERWAELEGRSKRRHLDIVMRRLGELMEQNPGELARLGLIGPSALPMLAR